MKKGSPTGSRPQNPPLHPHEVHHKRLLRRAKRIHTPHIGLRMLTGYTALLAAVYIAYFFTELLRPGAFFKTTFFTMMIDSIMVLSLLAVTFGLMARTRWAWSLGIAWYAIAIAHSVFIATFLRGMFLFIPSGLLALSIGLVLLLNGVIIWYLYEKRKYFTDRHHHDHFGTVDKVFVYLLILFWVLLLTIGTTVALNAYRSTTRLADETIAEFRLIPFSSASEKLAHCDAKQDPARDVCILTLSSVEKDPALCREIRSGLYRFSCDALW